MYVPTCSSIAPRNVHRSPAIGCALEQRTAQSTIHSLSETRKTEIPENFFKTLHTFHVLMN